jgi:hypothetical protein
MLSVTPISREIGETENVLRALLSEVLANTPVRTYLAYLGMSILTAAPAGMPRNQLARQVARSARVPGEETAVVVDNLEVTGLIVNLPGQSDVMIPSDRGAAAMQAIRSEVAKVSQRVYEGIPEDDLVIAKRTLATIHERASAEVARGAG